MNRIYLDNAATTAPRPEVVEAMLPFLRERFANPSSPHSSGQFVRRALDEARERTAAALQAAPDEIVFTGSGSEADSLAIVGIMKAYATRGRGFITSAVEHDAVLNAAKALRARGADVTILPVDAEGFVAPNLLRAALSDKTVLVSIMHANNEIGTVQRIRELADAAHEAGALFHSDAVQTVGHIEADVRALGVDALSLSAHKFEGPKGVGALYMRQTVKLDPMIFGGGQEGGRRSGTENVHGIVGLATALALAVAEQPEVAARVGALRDRFIDGVLAAVEACALNGPRAERLPNNASLRFDGVDGANVVLALDLDGIEASTGSACASGSLAPSHVLTALGLDGPTARQTVRFSLGRTTTVADMERAAAVVPDVIARLRHVGRRTVAAHRT